MDKETVRISFDVPVSEHIFLKTACVQARIPFKVLMKDVFHKTVEDFKKKELLETLSESIQQAKEGKVRTITLEELDQLERDLENDI